MCYLTMNERRKECLTDGDDVSQFNTISGQCGRWWRLSGNRSLYVPRQSYVPRKTVVQESDHS